TTVRQPSLSRAVCPADVVLPAVPGDGPTIVPFWFHAEARDAADRQIALDIPLRIARLARIDSFTFAVGGLAGNQPFVVRGRDFLPGSQALVDGVPILPSSTAPGGTPGGELLNDKPGQSADGVSNQSGGSNQSIVGLTPPRARPGFVPVQVRSPAGTVSSLYGFSYVGPPNIRDVQPATGPRAGGNRIVIKGNDLRYDAVVYIGPTRERGHLLLNLQTSVTENKIVGCVPPGDGTVSVWVEDPVTGEGVYPDAYTYENSDAGTSTTSDGDATCR
ncbi:MAG: IPT/TIG domain-containing protein, partial [Myxococcales bacterium]